MHFYPGSGCQLCQSVLLDLETKFTEMLASMKQEIKDLQKENALIHDDMVHLKFANSDLGLQIEHYEEEIHKLQQLHETHNDNITTLFVEHKDAYDALREMDNKHSSDIIKILPDFSC